MTRQLLGRVLAGIALISTAITPLAAQNYVLLTPTGYLFASLGRSTGQALGNLAVIRGQAAAFERRIERARTDFSKCHPKCPREVSQRLSLALFEKDLYYFERETMRAADLLFGKGPEADWWHRQTNKWISGVRGGDADGQIVRQCKDKFQNWVSAFMAALPSNASASLDREIRIATLKKTQAAYAPYQRCRDQAEIARAEKATMFLD